MENSFFLGLGKLGKGFRDTNHFVFSKNLLFLTLGVELPLACGYTSQNHDATGKQQVFSHYGKSFLGIIVFVTVSYPVYFINSDASLITRGDLLTIVSGMGFAILSTSDTMRG